MKCRIFRKSAAFFIIFLCALCAPARGATLASILDAILTALEGMMPGARCSILILDPDDGTLRHGAAPSLPSGYLRAIDGLRPGPSAGSCGTAAHFGSPVLVPDIAAYEQFLHAELFRLPGVTHVRSSIVLKEVKSDVRLPVPMQPTAPEPRRERRSAPPLKTKNLGHP